MLVAKGRGDMIRASEKAMARRLKFPYKKGKPITQFDTIFGRQMLHEMGFRTPSGRMVGNDGRSLDWHRKHGTDGSRVSWKQQRRVAPDVTSANPTKLGKSLFMPNGVVAAGDVAKSNIREYPYLHEWVRDSFAATTTRNVLNPTDLYASSRLMVQSQAAADGQRVRGRKLKRLTQAERRFAEGRMMLYSPLGRGAVSYG